jgi:aerotaxis receptor
MLNKQHSVSDEEVDFQLKDMFVSKTDKKGIIQYGNQVFTHLSGYTNEELIGSPHNIIRHAHMPRTVFKLFWSYLKENKAIFAYVKNQAKSGRYYWVMAAVMPTSDGYFSVRIKPNCGILSTVEALYNEVLSVEKEKGMDSALQFINEKLQNLGFSSYNEFMIHAVTEELASREDAMTSFEYYPHGLRQNASAMQKNLFEMQSRVLNTKATYSNSVAQLAKYRKFKENSQDSIYNITKSLPKLEHLSINMSVAANKLGKQGSTLAVVSSYFDKTAKDVVSLLGQIESSFTSVSDKLSTIIINSSCSRLMIEMIGQYLNEVQNEMSKTIMSDSQKAILLKRNKEMLTTFSAFLDDLKPQKNIFLDETFDLKKTIDLLIRCTSKLDLVKTGAKLESSNSQTILANFQPFITEISQIISSITEALNFMKEQIHQLCEDFENINISTVLVEHTIKEILLMNEGLKIYISDQNIQHERVA